MKTDNATTTPSKNLKTLIITITAIVLSAILVYLITSAIVNTNKGRTDGYYLGDTFHYDKIDITVNDITEKKVSTDNSERWLLTITFNLKNNSKEEFKFFYDSIYLKTEDKGEKYDYALLSLGDVISYYTLMAGGNTKYTINYYVPYSITEKNYVMYFDFKFFYKIPQCKLYERATTALDVNFR